MQMDEFITNQTRLLVLDMMFYNPNTDFFTIVIIESKFKANGQVDNRKVQFMNIMGDYYNFDNPLNFLRLILEFLYFIILILYILIEVNQILKQIYHQFELSQKEQENEEKKNAAKIKNRIRRNQENDEEKIN